MIVIKINSVTSLANFKKNLESIAELNENYLPLFKSFVACPLLFPFLFAPASSKIDDKQKSPVNESQKILRDICIGFYHGKDVPYLNDNRVFGCMKKFDMIAVVGIKKNITSTTSSETGVDSARREEEDASQEQVSRGKN